MSKKALIKWLREIICLSDFTEDGKYLRGEGVGARRGLVQGRGQGQGWYRGKQSPVPGGRERPCMLGPPPVDKMTD